MKVLATQGSNFIYTNLIQKLIRLSYIIFNFNNAKLKIHHHFNYWKEYDILNFPDVIEVFRLFMLSIVTSQFFLKAL